VCAEVAASASQPLDAIGISVFSAMQTTSTSQMITPRSAATRGPIAWAQSRLETQAKQQPARDKTTSACAIFAVVF